MLFYAKTTRRDISLRVGPALVLALVGITAAFSDEGTVRIDSEVRHQTILG